MPRCKVARSEPRSILEKVCEQASDETTPQMGVFQLNAESEGKDYPFSGKLFDILMRGSVVPSASWSCSILACL